MLTFLARNITDNKFNDEKGGPNILFFRSSISAFLLLFHGRGIGNSVIPAFAGAFEKKNAGVLCPGHSPVFSSGVSSCLTGTSICSTSGTTFFVYAEPR